MRTTSPLSGSRQESTPRPFLKVGGETLDSCSESSNKGKNSRSRTQGRCLRLARGAMSYELRMVRRLYPARASVRHFDPSRRTVRVGMRQRRPAPYRRRGGGGPHVAARCGGGLFLPREEYKSWRVFYRIDSDAIVIADVEEKRSQQTPRRTLERIKARLQSYDESCGDEHEG